MSRGNWRQRGYDRQYDKNHGRVLREETHCWLCGELVDKRLSGRHPNGPSVDHIIPRSQGGSNARSNLRLAHKHCNEGRDIGTKQPKRAREQGKHPGIL